MKKFVQTVGKVLIETESFNEILSAVDAFPQHLLPEFHAYLSSPYDCVRYFPYTTRSSPGR